jgi:Domain of unknown function (DUF4382)
MLALVVSICVAACGGSSNDASGAGDTPQPATGTVALLFTDRPSDEFSAIKLNVVESILIGGSGAGGQQVLFQGVEPIDLLDLTNFSEPIVFGEVNAGIFSKLRLLIDSLELVPKDGSPSIFPALPANGKIDLLDPAGIEVLPGRTLLVEIDMEANKAIHVVSAGNNNRYQFRPVVRATFWDGDLGNLPDKLARLEGTASDVDPAARSFRLCDIETPASCIDVATGIDTSLFGSEGTAADFNALTAGEPVVVIGHYSVDGSISLNAIVVEIGGNAEQVKGNVVSDPADDRFLMVVDGDGDVVVELQPGTKYFDANGGVDASAIILGSDVEVEGVRPPVEAGDPELLRAALVFVEGAADEQLSGTIIEPLDGVMRSFGLTPTAGSDTCVRVDDEAAILLVDITASEVTMGGFEDLAVGQLVDLFGTTATDGCFDANEVIVDLNASSP